MATDLFHFRQFDIRQSHAAMKVGTDSDLLGALCAGGDRILDIGTGTGVLSLMLAQRYPRARITAIDIDPDAVTDAAYNFSHSPWADRLTLYHTSLQDYLADTHAETFDAVVCNPPYFHRSLLCPNQARARARHDTTLPFDTLIQGAHALLVPDGRFSVCVPPEVLDLFTLLCQQTGFAMEEIHHIRTVPDKPPKRHVLICRKGPSATPRQHHHCMRNPDRTRSPWYLALMQDFLLCDDR